MRRCRERQPACWQVTTTPPKVEP